MDRECRGGCLNLTDAPSSIARRRGDHYHPQLPRMSLNDDDLETTSRLAESTRALVARSKQDPRAREEFWRRLLKRATRWARGKLPPFARGLMDTDDLATDVMLRTVKAFERFEPRGPHSFGAYLAEGLRNG